jgi:TonB-dependent starch-binding outer membrane protein SusC
MKETKRSLPLRSFRLAQKTLLIALAVVSIFLFSDPAHAKTNFQSHVISGKITDPEGKPLGGVTIQEKGTNNGTTSKEDGSFSINVANENAILQISFVGYASQEYPVKGNSMPNISLQRSGTDLEQVVVVGYGTQKKKDLTGSVASVNLEALKETPNTNIGQYLQGTVPGLNVGLSTFAGGTPPISIRGVNTISGNQNVLIILDGIQYNQSLSSINPDDIASIDVLKDASSTAVYGAQAANGVILITTRKGRNSTKPRISFSTSYSTQEPTVDLRPMNRAEYLENIRQAFWNNPSNPSFMPDGVTPNPNFKIETVVDATMATPGRTALLPNDFDWWKATTKTGQIVETNLGISGGSDRFNYLLSGGLVDQRGFIINDKFKRKSLRANLEVKALPWWKVGLISSGSFVNQDGAEPSVGLALIASPLQVPYDSSGKVIAFPTGTLVPNPFITYDIADYDRNNYYFANVYSDIDFPFLKGLNYRMNFGNNYRTTTRSSASIYGAVLAGSAGKFYENYYDYTFDNILTYNRDFGKHGVTATLLYGAIERKLDNTSANATGFTRLFPLSYNSLQQGNIPTVSSGGYTEALNYQMARVNYRFNSRYLLTATVRRDGFSGFAENFKNAYFPSLGLGWNISDEPFMQNVKPVSFLKLRLTYGVIGNQTNRYSSIATVNTGAAYIFGDGGQTAFGQQVGALGNPDLKWERTKGINLGVDFTLLNNKLSGIFDYYRNTTNDLLYSVVIPTITGFGNIQTNLGELVNNGIEASLTYNFINKADLKWSSTLNFWRNHDKVVALTGIDANGDGKEDDVLGSNSTNGLFIGKSQGAIYYYQNDHIYQVGQTTLPGFFTGSMALVDQDKSGTITPVVDRVHIGSQMPAYRFSWMNNFEYKGFSLMVFFNAIQGGKNGYLGNNTRTYFRDDNAIRNNDLAQVHYWSPTTPNAKYPRVTNGTTPAQPPEFWESRSFIRLQDLSLSYNLGRLVKKQNFQALNFYVSGKNLFTWTDWEGWDPESTVPNQPLVPYGLVTDARPTLRTFTVGLNITY